MERGHLCPQSLRGTLICSRFALMRAGMPELNLGATAKFEVY
jgi:hypothetical protein